MTKGDLPIGEAIAALESVEVPARSTYRGHFLSLSPVDPQGDVDQLFANSHGDSEVEKLWTYMPYGPFSEQAEMTDWLQTCQASSDPLFLTVKEAGRGERIGMVSFLNAVAQMRRVELGHIWYSPKVQRTKVNTEAVYLMLCEAFDRLRYRRVEWKCDALNARSRAAALRLGFSFEGVFAQHVIVKGRNRDTAWYAMLDREWSQVKANMERWLYAEVQQGSLRALNASVLREGEA